jgi:serine/threonine protein kinase
MAPEQVDATFGETSNLSDIYALGAILYEMMTGRAPFSGTPIRILWQKLNEMPASPSSVNEAVPVALDPICERAMARPPGDRFASAHELGDALRHVLESLEE